MIAAKRMSRLLGAFEVINEANSESVDQDDINLDMDILPSVKEEAHPKSVTDSAVDTVCSVAADSTVKDNSLATAMDAAVSSSIRENAEAEVETVQDESREKQNTAQEKVQEASDREEKHIKDMGENAAQDAVRAVDGVTSSAEGIDTTEPGSGGCGCVIA